MAKVYIFGSASLSCLPDSVRVVMQNLLNQGAEFYIGDNSTVDFEVQKNISALGVAKQSTIVGLDTIRNNRFGLKEKLYAVEFDEESKVAKIINSETKEEERVFSNIANIDVLKQNQNYKDFIKHTLIKESDFVLCLYDGVTKNTLTTMDFVYACNKPNYIYELVKA